LLRAYDTLIDCLVITNPEPRNRRPRASGERRVSAFVEGPRSIQNNPGCQFASNCDPHFASKRGSDSISMIFGGDVVLFSKGNQQHGAAFAGFVPHPCRFGR
jgi:hypothetical protein